MSGGTGDRRAAAQAADPAVDASPTGPGSPAAGAADLRGWQELLAGLAPAGDDAARIEQLRLLEDIKSGCAAAQARITARFAASRRAAAADPDVRAGAGAAGSGSVGARERRVRAARLAARSAAAEVALARRESPARGGRFVGLAEALVREMPRTLAALQRGVISEWRATLIVRETAFLSVEQRAVVDAELDGRLDGVGEARLVARVRALAYRLDPQGAVDRSVRAAADRRVSVRPAPDAMAYLTTLMPMVTAVACFAELDRRAKTAVVAGDGRTHAQRMADEVARLLLGAIATPTSGHTAPDGATPAPTTGHTATDGATPTATTEPTAPGGTPATGAGDAGVRESAADVERPDTSGGDGERPDPSGGDGERPDPPGGHGERSGGDGGRRVGLSEQEFEPAADEDASAGAAARPGCDPVPFDDPVAAVRAAYQAAVERDRARQATGPPEATAGPPPPNPAPRTADAGGGSPPGTADPPQPPADPPAAAIGQAGPEPVPAGAAAAGSRLPADPLGIPRGTPVMINLVITDRTLFGDGDDPAILPGNHPIPAPLARRMLTDLDPTTRVWIRRLYTHPDSDTWSPWTPTPAASATDCANC